MLSAKRIHSAGRWSGTPADLLPLSADGRKRLVMRTPRGLAFFLELPGAESLKEGDAIELEDGRLVEIVGPDGRHQAHDHVHSHEHGVACTHDHSHDHAREHRHDPGHDHDHGHHPHDHD